VLQLANNNSWTDTDFACESDDIIVFTTKLSKVIRIFFWDQDTGSEIVCLNFMLRIFSITWSVFKIQDQFAAMKNEVRCLMEKGKPEMIVGQIPRAHHDNRFVRGDKACCATGAARL
jgi:hypothetical protein